MQELGSNEASASVLGNHGHEKERSCVPCIADGAGLSGWPWPTYAKAERPGVYLSKKALLADVSSTRGRSEGGWCKACQDRGGAPTGCWGGDTW